jgi:hypothetical protein
VLSRHPPPNVWALSFRPATVAGPDRPSGLRDTIKGRFGLAEAELAATPVIRQHAMEGLAMLHVKGSLYVSLTLYL